MERGYRDMGRASLAADYDDYGSYDRPVRGAAGYLERDPPLRESYLGSTSGSSSSYRSGRSGYSGGGGVSYDREIMESIMQQRALQQQLSLRESQLALANSMLHQQQHQQQFLTKRRMDGPRGGDFRGDFKRPRLMDDRSRPRNRSTGRDSNAGGRARGPRGGSGGRRNQNAPRGHGQGSADRSKGPKDSYDPEKPTVDDEGKFRCRLCDVECKDDEEMKKHRSTSEHKDNVASAKASNDPNNSKGYCHICDVALSVSFLHHQRITFHKKRKIQVMKGCGWCKVISFKNFSEVLAHRSTEKHIKNQAMYGKRDMDETTDSESRRDSRGSGKSTRKEREHIKVELPPELSKFDPKAVVGQTCIITVTGWFCKLCNKFYNNENAAKETHCMTETHFNNYKKFMYNKLRVKALAERVAKEKEEEEQKKQEAEAAAAAEKEGGGDGEDGESSAEPSTEQQPANDQETSDPAAAAEGTEPQGAEEEMEVAENREMEEEEEEGGHADADAAAAEGGEEDGWAEGEEENQEEGEGETAAEESLNQEAVEDPAEAADVEPTEEISQEDEPMVTEESIEGDGGEAEGTQEEEEEEEEAVDRKKVTRATVSSPSRGRGRGAGTNRARRGRRVAK